MHEQHMSAWSSMASYGMRDNQEIVPRDEPSLKAPTDTYLVLYMDVYTLFMPLGPRPSIHRAYEHRTGIQDPDYRMLVP